ncbi:MAG: hypothetical protein ACTSYI_13690 [Promethearchaeota archaeon]
MEPNYTHLIQSGEIQILIISGTKYVSAALSIGIQIIKKMFLNEQVGLSNDDIQLVKELVDENWNVLNRLGEAD